MIERKYTDRFSGKTAVVYGDSIVYGAYKAEGDPGAVSRVDKRWCDFLPELLGLSSVTNRGESGTPSTSRHSGKTKITKV